MPSLDQHLDAIMVTHGQASASTHRRFDVYTKTADGKPAIESITMANAIVYYTTDGGHVVSQIILPIDGDPQKFFVVTITGTNQKNAADLYREVSGWFTAYQVPSPAPTAQHTAGRVA